MSVDYPRWAARIRELHQALASLAPSAANLGVPSPTGEEWYEHLERKLLPQLNREPLLVVAVVGGTNIGKSCIFNHLAGEQASSVSPLAAGTKHPVCLVPPGFTDEAALRAIFEGFQLERWQSQEDALRETPEHLVFWRVGANVPPKLLLLDTPDIDSDAAVNWQRADGIRRVADVLVGVLTQQKYNDAAVKSFFRKAAEVDKVVTVVINQTDLVEDREYWPKWLATFSGETGNRPELIYCVPHDRAAAREMRLPFYALEPGETAKLADKPSSLRDELAALRFDAIKIRTFRGAIAQVLDPATGAPHYLARLKARGKDFAEASAALEAAERTRIHWPSLPSRLLVTEIRDWWDDQRAGLSRTIHGGYRWLGDKLTWPLRKAHAALRGEERDPLESFTARERATVVFAVENLLDELERLSKVGNDTLRPRLEKLLSGGNRQQLLDRVGVWHASLPAIDDDYRTFVRSELARWSGDNPKAVNVLRSLDNVAAFARPAITVTLCVSGWIVAGSLVHEAAMQAATHTMTNVATEAAITGGIAGGGEMLVQGTSDGIGLAAARLFQRLQSHYAEQRAKQLAAWLDRELLGGLLSQLRTGSEMANSPEFKAAEGAIRALRAIRDGAE